jgi:hypothetical protein
MVRGLPVMDYARVDRERCAGVAWVFIDMGAVVEVMYYKVVQ